jgi:hypothetical protein
MAGERLYGEFTDDKGTDWRVSIYDTNAAWNAANKTEFTLGAEGFVIRPAVQLCRGAAVA